MNKIYASFICHQNNTRTSEFRIFKNNFIMLLLSKMTEKNMLVIEKDLIREVIISKKKNYRLKGIKPHYSFSHLQCLRLIRRKTDTSGNKDIIFSTSRGLLDINQLFLEKVGGVPLFIINYK